MAQALLGHFNRDVMRRVRAERGWTQAELAEKAQVNVDSVYDWENGRARPSVTSLGKLAEALDLRVEDLYTAPTTRALLGDLRVKAGLSQEKFVFELNKRLRLSPRDAITRSQVSNWERGKTLVPQEYGVQYADLLRVDIHELRWAINRTLEMAGREKYGEWSPLVDRREQDFKGVAAGNPELAFIYGVAADAYSMVFGIAWGDHFRLSEKDDFETHGLVDDDGLPLGYDNRPYDEIREKVGASLWALIKRTRERTVEILDQARDVDEDIVARARGSFEPWTSTSPWLKTSLACLVRSSRSCSRMSRTTWGNRIGRHCSGHF